MSTWNPEELAAIDAADELRIAWRRQDGAMSAPTIIWVVRHDDDVYVRSVNGREAGWYRYLHGTLEGRIEAGGVERDVTFEDAGGEIDDALDAAYRAKYRRYSSAIVDRTTTPEARSATIRLVPR